MSPSRRASIPSHHSLTDALVHRVHAHVLVQLFPRCAVRRARVLWRDLSGKSVGVFQPLLEFGGSQVGEGQADHHHHASEVIRKIQSFGQFCSDDGE